MKFKFLLIVALNLVLFSNHLFAQVPCDKLTVDSIYPFEDNPAIIMVRITNHDTDLWSPNLIGVINPSKDTLASSVGCGCVALLPGVTGNFPINLVTPFTISADFSCTVVLESYPYTKGTECFKKYTLRTANVSVVNNKAKLNLFPNPAKNNLYIDLSESSGDNRVVIVNLQGQSIYSEKIAGQGKNLNVSSFKQGVYFVQLYSSGALTTTRKLVIE